MNPNNKKMLFAMSAFFLTAANFAGKLMGFLRDILISNYYGASAQTDAFFLALSIPTILIGVFTSSADSSVIPQYTRISQQEGRGAADRYFSNIITILTSIALVIAVVTLLWPQGIVRMFAPTFSQKQLAWTCQYLRIFSFAGLLHIWYCFFCTYLLCYEKTTVRIILSMLTNAIVLPTLLVSHDSGMITLAIAYLLGSLFCAVLPLCASVRAGYHYRWTMNIEGYHFPEFFHLFLPIMGSALLVDFLLFCDRFLSSFLEAGSISALNYASKITSIFDSIVVVGVGTILIPALSRFTVEEDLSSFRYTISAVIFGIVLVLLPVAVLCVLYSREIISILYLRGAFTQDNAALVSLAFCAYAPGILFKSLQAILVKSLHSMENTRFPFCVSLVAFFCNIILSALLMLHFGIFGIALATTVSCVLSCVCLLGYLLNHVGFDTDFLHWTAVPKLGVAVCPCALPYFLLPPLSSQLVSLLLRGGLSALLCYGSLLLLFHRQLLQCWHSIRN